MAPPTPSVLLVGKTDSELMRKFAAVIGECIDPANQREISDVRELRGLIASDGWFPDLVVVVQDWPDQYPADDVHELIAQCPLARIICCFGHWCDSDGRTRSIWPLAVRVSPEMFAARFERELGQVSGTAPAGGPALLPLTASRTEIFEFDFQPEVVGAERPAVLVISPDRAWREMIEGALGLPGAKAAGGATVSRPQTIVFDADPWDQARRAALAEVRRAHPGVRIVACVGFPRPDLDADLRKGGADAIWYKLGHLAELVRRLAVPAAGPAA
jgi:hypothetical protein